MTQTLRKNRGHGEGWVDSADEGKQDPKMTLLKIGRRQFARTQGKLKLVFCIFPGK